MALFHTIKSLPLAVKQYLLITANYWAFTLTDGALRMLVVLYFHQLGYSPLNIAMLFLFYEFFGVVTNLLGGWLGARIGLNKTMNIGLGLQVGALLMLAVPDQYLTVLWVMLAQALSGIAKDLNKMSAKSSIKSLLPSDKNADATTGQHSQLFKWVTLLTGSKNALKGLGYFLGTLLLLSLGFRASVLVMAAMLALMAVLSIWLLTQELGKAKTKAKFSQLFSRTKALNYLSAARLCLFASRDVWFVVALPVFFSQSLGWQHDQIGLFMACWIIFYGIVQATTPQLIKNKFLPSGRLVAFWGLMLTLVTGILAALLFTVANAYAAWLLTAGLLIFGGVFAINSSMHSYLVVALAREDGISLDVGFYYMANALGRLLGTILSGLVFQLYGLVACLVVSLVLAGLAALLVNKVEH